MNGLNFFNDTNATDTSFRGSNKNFSISEVRNRLDPQIFVLFDLYPSLNLLGEFVEISWKQALLLPSTSKVAIARIVKSSSKLLSDLKKNLPANSSVSADLYLSTMQVLLDDLRWWMLNNQGNSMYASSGDGGTVVELSPSAFYALKEVESWDPMTNILYRGDYSSPFMPDEQLQKILQGTTFIVQNIS